MKELILGEIKKSISVFEKSVSDEALLGEIITCVEVITTSLRNNKKILLAGNGGSAADAQHIAGEFVSRFNYDRDGLAALALTVDTSVLTAIGNDYGYDHVFARQIQAVGSPGDIFWCYSTSGKSRNILSAMSEARNRGLTVIGFTGERGWPNQNLCNISIKVPSNETPKIQEAHLLFGHIICGLVESAIFPTK